MRTRRITRNILSGALSFVFLAASTAVMAEKLPSVEYVSEGYISLEGTYEYEASGNIVTLTVTTKELDWTDEEQWLDGTGADISYYADTTLTDDKAYSFNFKLSESDIYNVYLASKTADVEKSQLVFINSVKNDEVITAALEADTPAALKDAIDDNLSDLGAFSFDSEDVTDNVSGFIFNELTGKTEISPADMRSLVEKAIITAKIEDGTLNNFYDYEYLNLLNEKIFEFCGEHIGSDVVNELRDKTINSVSAFDTELINATILTLANGSDDAATLKEALSEYKEVLEIEKSITTKLCEAILSEDDFESCEEICEFIEDYKGSSGSGGGGGGGGGGSGSSGGSGGSSGSGGSGGGIISTGKDNSYNGAVVEAETDNSIPQEIAVFEDIESVDWASTAITELYKKKIINGKSDGLFHPYDKVTREEFAKILMLAFEVNLIDDECPFTDISESDWSYEYIKTAYLAGVVNGIGNNTFGKSLNISRQDLCVMAYRILTTANSKFENAEAVSTFADSHTVAGYAANAVAFMQANGVVDGDQNGNFNPYAASSRAEAVKIVYNTLTLYENSK